jgi:hypothetical protein
VILGIAKSDWMQLSRIDGAFLEVTLFTWLTVGMNNDLAVDYSFYTSHSDSKGTLLIENNFQLLAS